MLKFLNLGCLLFAELSKNAPMKLCAKLYFNALVTLEKIDTPKSYGDEIFRGEITKILRVIEVDLQVDEVTVVVDEIPLKILDLSLFVGVEIFL